jgi:hypothetical protein
LCLLAAGCSSMLPRGSTSTPSPFSTFDEAEDAAEKIVPFKTLVSELKGLGFDPEAGTNVTLIPYPEIIARLAPYQGVPLAELDPGIRRCIQAQRACRAYRFHFAREDRAREGSFWPDFFNVRRVTSIKGWWFDALVVVSDGTVLFRNVAGQARTDRVEKQTNPLGPFQRAGESAGSALIN